MEESVTEMMRNARRGVRGFDVATGRHDAALGSVLGTVVAVRARDRHPGALPHHRRTIA